MEHEGGARGKLPFPFAFLFALLLGAAAGWLIGLALSREGAGEGGSDALGMPLPPLSEGALVRPSSAESPFGMTCFDSRLDRQAVADYLRKSLRTRGWVEDAGFTQVVAENSGRVVLSFHRGNERLISGLSAREDGGTRVTNLSWRSDKNGEGLR